MQAVSQALRIAEPPHSGLVTVKTTLFDLIQAVNEEVNSKEEQCVPLIVGHILEICKPFHGFDGDIPLISAD